MQVHLAQSLVAILTAGLLALFCDYWRTRGLQRAGVFKRKPKRAERARKTHRIYPDLTAAQPWLSDDGQMRRGPRYPSAPRGSAELSSASRQPLSAVIERALARAAQKAAVHPPETPPYS